MKVKRATAHSLPTGWFPKPEFKRIVDATYAYGGWHGGRDFQFRADRLRALVLLMRWSGLAIQDAVTLERDRLSDDGKLFLYRAKTGVPVYVPIPPDVAEILRALPSCHTIANEITASDHVQISPWWMPGRHSAQLMCASNFLLGRETALRQRLNAKRISIGSSIFRKATPAVYCTSLH